MIDVLPEHLKIIIDILKSFVPSFEVRAFGSRCKGKAKKYSDLDLVIVGNEKIDSNTILEIKEAFEESNLPYRVDVLDWNAISENFRKIINEKYEVIQKAECNLNYDIFKEFTLQEVCEKITDGSHFSPKEIISGFPMASVKDLTRHGIDMSTCKRISESDFMKLVKQGCSPKKGDVIIAKDGNSSLDTVCVYNQDDAIVLLSSVAILRPNEKVMSDYLNYYLDCNETRKFLKENYRSGSAIPRVILRDFRNAPIKVPPIDIQKNICNIFRSLDDKIELNRKMNETLEKTAQAIFRHWFIDFEFPGENGKPYKSSGGKMVETELGEIPEKWKIKSLDDIANFLNGIALQKFPPVSEEYLPVIKIREIKQGITESTDKASKNVDFKYIINNGDVLFSWSGSLEVVIWTFGKGALNQHLFKVSSLNFPKWFFYFWLKEHLNNFKKIADGKATTMGHIQRHHLSEALVIIPDEIIMNKINQLLTSIIDQIISNGIQTRNLSQIRDSLLPKLMSGKIRVK